MTNKETLVSNEPFSKEEALAAAVASSTNYAEVLRALGSTASGTAYRYLQRRILNAGLSTEHFTSQKSNPMPPRQPARRRPWQEVLVLRDTNEERVNGKVLRFALVSAGVQEVCALCDNEGKWNGKVLRLQIDHINGVRTDDRKENLRFLCPNCHSQQPTSRPKRKPRPECVDCGKEVSLKATRCLSCSNKKRFSPGGSMATWSVEKIEWPSLSELLALTQKHGFVGAGRILGVSDNAVRKRIAKIQKEQNPIAETD